MRVLAYNIKDGAAGDAGNRLELVAQVVRESGADLVCLAELAGWAAVGTTPAASRRFHRFQELSGLRGLVLEGPSRSPVGVFLRGGVEVECAGALPGRFHHAALAVTLRRHGRRPLVAISTHLDPFSATGRSAEAERIAWYVEHHARDADVLVAGDLNSVAGDDLEQGLYGADPPPGTSVRLLGPDGRLDRTPVDRLTGAGLADCYRLANPALAGFTDPTPAFAEPGEPRARIDLVLATAGLAARIVSAQVLTAPPADRASDHFPLLVEFED